MKKLNWKLITFCIILGLVMVVVLSLATNVMAKKPSGKLPIHFYYASQNKQVYRIDVTEHSYYLIDTRFNACFYETLLNGQSISVVSVPCHLFDEAIQGMK